MEYLPIIILVVVSAGFFFSALAIAWVYLRTSAKMDALNAHITETKVQQRQTTESFGEIQKSIGELSEAGRQMKQVGEEISSLNDILRAPKFRGGIGELLLDDLLKQMLPAENFRTQHPFKSGERCDAVIVLQAGMVPVDAKFPLESFQRLVAAADDDQRSRHRREFNRAVKVHIDAIARKYILPDEGTFNFALMYIPAENVYYETIIKDEGNGDQKSLLNYALEKRVIPVSPNSFYAYLQAIVLGLKGLQIEKRAYEIMRYLDRLKGDFDHVRQEYGVLGGHIERTGKKYAETSRLLERFDLVLATSYNLDESVPPPPLDELPE